MALSVPVAEIVKNSKNPLLGKHDSWGRVLLGDIAQIQNGYAFQSSLFNKKEGVPLIRIRDVGKDNTDTNFTGEYDPEYIVEPGDFLIGMDGDFNCARWKGPKGLLNQRVCRIILASENYHPKLLDYTLPGYLKAINEMTSSVTVKHLSSKSISEIPLPFPPTIELQNRIVAEIEKQFSRLDQAVENLKRVKANLKRYKAAVLKAAVEGKLTEQWRKEHPEVEPADKLLQRILAERRKNWEENELAKMKAKGKVPKDDKWKEKYIEPTAPNVSDSIQLPHFWEWARLDAIAGIQGGITKDSKRKSGNCEAIPYLRVANVQRGFLDLSEIKYIDVPNEKIDELLLEDGDILFNEGGDRDKLGRGWIWESQIRKCIYQNHVFRARLFLKKYVKGKLISWFGNTYGQYYFMSKGKQTTNLASINKTMLSALPVPIPPIKEQIQLVQEIEKYLSACETVEKQVEKNMLRADRLRQAILKKAFSGQLIESPLDKVSIDTLNYEPSVT